MKTSTLALVLSSLSLVACAAPAANEVAADEAAANVTREDAMSALVSNANEGVTVFRGDFAAHGARFVLEVVVTSKELVKQTKGCEPADADQDAWAASWISPDYDVQRNSRMRTIVRDASGAIVGDASLPFVSFTTSGPDLEAAEHCTKAGKVKDTTVSTAFEMRPLAQLPGVAVETADGPIWINPSYLGVANEWINLEGTATYRSLGPNTIRQGRPFGGAGEELVFTQGELLFQGPSSITVEVGTDIQQHSHAKTKQTIALARQ